MAKSTLKNFYIDNNGGFYVLKKVIDFFRKEIQLNKEYYRSFQDDSETNYVHEGEVLTTYGGITFWAPNPISKKPAAKDFTAYSALNNVIHAPESMQIQFASTTLNQLRDSGNIVNTTVKPDVFFKRLNFILDLLLRLQPLEKYQIFKSSGSPTKDYERIISNLEATVDDFIDRAVYVNQRKMDSLKTDRAKKKCFVDFACALIAAFDCANTFWEGDKGFPHYTGSLFTENNYATVQEIWESASSEKYDYD